jgi:hypothetical protein
MEVTWKMLLICCPLVMLGGFIDAIAGGGGLITLPSYFLAGLPAHFAYGTNKFGSACGTAMAVSQYHRGGKIRWDYAPLAVLAAFAGAWCGAKIGLYLPERALQLTMMVILPIVGVFLITNRHLGEESDTPVTLTRLRRIVAPVLIGFFVGAYDGFFGPGTGTFYTLAFTMSMGLSLIEASGTAKVLNLVSNLTALVAYLLSGKVVFALAIPCAICSMIGNFIGAKMAVRVGAPLIRKMMTVVMVLLLIKVASSFFS